MPRRHLFSRSFLILALALAVSLPALAGDTPDPVPLDRWLLAGPAPFPAPVFLGDGNPYPVKDLLSAAAYDPDRTWVRAGDHLDWNPGPALTWTAIGTPADALAGSTPAGEARIAFLTLTIHTPRWQTVELALDTNQPARVALDGKVVLERDKASARFEPDETLRQDLTLLPGAHRLFITAVQAPGSATWTLQATLRPQLAPITLSREPTRTLTLEDITDATSAAGVDVAPDGSAFAVRLGFHDPDGDEDRSWVEIRRLPGGELERSIRDSGGVRNLAWSHDSRRLCFMTRGKKDTADLQVLDRDTGRSRILLDNVKHLSGAWWAPDDSYILYTVTDVESDTYDRFKLIDRMEDRYHYSGNRSHLHLVMVDSGARRRLTYGEKSVGLSYNDFGDPISPDGRKILLIRNDIDLSTRPFNRQTFMVLDLATNHLTTLFSGLFWYECSGWTPDGRTVWFIGSRSAGHPGLNNEEENDFYLLDPATGKLRSLTDDFAPSIRGARWTADGTIYLLADDGSHVRIYRTDPAGSRFDPVDTGVEVVREFDLARDGRRLVFSGEGLTTPKRYFDLELPAGPPREVLVPDARRWADVRFGRVEEFDFTNARNHSIEGWLYYPADFNPDHTYPMIVYYYGGVFPTSRYFSQRLLYQAAHGYIVYVLNPSGAIGWGPEFANLHVNDWGKIVTQEIATGVKAVLAAKPFIDPARVGAYGGSYGGFMTLEMGVKTDIFRAIVSMYGISDIASHWGAGYWGYAYGAYAAADSYPWNRPDIYVDRSPLFHADAMKAAVLLLHGDADVNVRYGESEQMFTALKVLGKDVEMVRFRGEDHGISGTREARIMQQKLLLAWFDKYLKDQPEFWSGIWQKKH